MPKIFGSISKNEKKSNDRQPDLRGYLKIGGHKGKGAEERNRESAAWLRNVAKEFTEDKQCFVNIAGWKRTGEDGEHYISLSIEDNAWRTREAGSGDGGRTQRSAPDSGGQSNEPSGGEAIEDIIPF